MRKRDEEYDMPEYTEYVVECYTKSADTGNVELTKTRRYSDYNDAWANTIGPIRVSKPPVGAEFSVLTKHEYRNVPSGNRDVPDDCDSSVAFVEYYIDDPDMESL
jgi:hypothetical protein